MRQYKKIKLVSIMILLNIIMLSACGQQEQADNIELSTDSTIVINETKTEPIETEPVEYTVESLVNDAFTKTGPVEDANGFLTEVKYHVPEIQLDSDGAREINAEILAVCSDIMAPEFETVDWWEVSYQAFLNDDILSILLVKRQTNDANPKYYTYNFKVSTGTVLNGEALLTEAGFDKDSVLQGLRKKMAYLSDSCIASLFESFYFNYPENALTEKQDIYAAYLRERNRAISAYSTNLDFSMFLNDEGKLCIPTMLYLTSDPNAYTHIVQPMFESNAKDFEINYADSVCVRYQNGRMTICLKQDGEGTFDTGNVVYEKEYEVQGTFKDYVCGEMVDINGDGYMMPVFLADDGMVSYIDLVECAQAGAFVLTEPAYSLSNIEEFSEESRAKIREALKAITFDRYAGFSGSVMNLWETRRYRTAITHRTADGTECTDNYFLGFDPDRINTFLFQVSNCESDKNLDYEGWAKYLGMNNNGLVMSYEIEEQTTGDVLKGAFEMKKYLEWVDGDYIEWCDLRSIGGSELFDSDDDIVKMRIEKS